MEWLHYQQWQYIKRQFLIVFSQAEDGMTVLHYAAKAGYVDVLMTLLESDDADVNMQVSAIIGNKSIEKT